jgi:hypothetical protein
MKPCQPTYVLVYHSLATATITICARACLVQPTANDLTLKGTPWCSDGNDSCHIDAALIEDGKGVLKDNRPCICWDSHGVMITFHAIPTTLLPTHAASLEERASKDENVE